MNKYKKSVRKCQLILFFILLHFLILLILLYFLLSLSFIFSYISVLQNAFLFVCSFLHLFPFITIWTVVTARQVFSYLHRIFKICCGIMKFKTNYRAVIISAVFCVSEVWTLSKSVEISSNSGKKEGDRNTWLVERKWRMEFLYQARVDVLVERSGYYFGN